MKLDRRKLFKGSVLAVTAGAVAGTARPSRGEEISLERVEASPRPWEIVDANINLFQWPFRRLPYDATNGLVEKLRTLNIKQAWAGSFEGLLHRDLGGVNARLAKACEDAPVGLLVPFGSVNPNLPDWEEDLRRCHESFAMPGIRLHPNYHDYTLRDPRFRRLLALAAERGLWVQLVASMEDRRTQHPQLQVADVDLAPLPDLLGGLPAAKLMLLNYRPPGTLPKPLAETAGIVFDTARVESTDGIARLMGSVSADRVVFGSHAPLLVMEAALIKVYESQLSESDVGQLVGRNADRMLAT